MQNIIPSTSVSSLLFLLSVIILVLSWFIFYPLAFSYIYMSKILLRVFISFSSFIKMTVSSAYASYFIMDLSGSNIPVIFSFISCRNGSMAIINSFMLREQPCRIPLVILISSVYLPIVSTLCTASLYSFFVSDLYISIKLYTIWYKYWWFMLSKAFSMSRVIIFLPAIFGFGLCSNSYKIASNVIWFWNINLFLIARLVPTYYLR